MRVDSRKCGVHLRFIMKELGSFLSIAKGAGGIGFTAEQTEESGYRLIRNSTGVSVTYHELTDFSRAFLTFAAMEAQGQKQYEKTEVRSMKEFGVMLDLSRNAVMRVDMIKRFICYAAMMGYTFIGLYMEDTIEIDGESYFGYMRGAMTSAQLKELDEYAARFGIEMRGYIQTLAHLNQIIRYEEYQEIIDTDDILLCEEEKTYQLIDRLLKTVSEAFSSREINIGMDEAYMVGLGKYLEKHGYHDRIEVIFRHLSRVMELCKKYGLKPEMWSDMFIRPSEDKEAAAGRQEPARILPVPDGLTLAYWDYFSTDKEHYGRMLKAHKKLAKDVSFAGSAWRFNGVSPHNRFSLKTGLAAAAALRAEGIRKSVITCWGDNGAEASSFSVLPALYMNAEYVYADDAECLHTETEKFKTMTGISFENFLKIDDSNTFDALLAGEKVNNTSKCFLFNDPLIGIFDSVVEEKKDIRQHYEKVIGLLSPLCKDETFGYLFETQKELCEVLKDKADLGVRLRYTYQTKDRQGLLVLANETIPAVLKSLDRFFAAFERQWMRENKSFGFEIQCLRIGGLSKRLEFIRRVLLSYLAGEQEMIEELEQMRKPFHYLNRTDIDTLRYHMWSDMVSAGVIG